MHRHCVRPTVEHLGRVLVGFARLKPPLGPHSWVPHLLQPLHVHGQMLGSGTPQHRRAARIFEWGGFVPIWSDLLRGSARRRSFYLSSWGCSSVSPAFGVWLPTSLVWVEKMTHRRPERTRGARGTRAHPQSRVRDVGWLPFRLPDRLPVEVLRALLCVATGAGAAFESHRKIEKSFSNSFLVFWVWADTPIIAEVDARVGGSEKSAHGWSSRRLRCDWTFVHGPVAWLCRGNAQQPSCGSRSRVGASYVEKE